MVPKITSGGGSFKGAFQYYLHDKEADTRDRIAWTQVENMRTSDPDKAWKVMAYTAQVQARLKEASGQSRAGRKLEKPVFAFSLAWHPEQSPTPAHMLATARKAIATLGLTEHEAVIVAHRDEPQKHVHVIVNRVHPISGMAGDVRNSKRKLSDFARAYEQEDGTIYCTRRVENYQQRQAGDVTRYADPHIVAAWETTYTGKDFVKALEAKGYRLAQGRKRLVVIDPHGKAHNPTRHLQGVKARDLQDRLKDLDLTCLPDAETTAPEKAPSQQAQPDKDAARRAQAESRSVQREAMQEKHQRERSGMVSQQKSRLASSKERLAAYYNLPASKNELLALKETIAHAPWWKILLGRTRKDRQTFAARIKAYKEDVARYRARMSQIVRQQRQDRRDLLARQHKEGEEMAAAFERDAHRQHRDGLQHEHENQRSRGSRQPPANTSKKNLDDRTNRPSSPYPSVITKGHDSDRSTGNERDSFRCSL